MDNEYSIDINGLIEQMFAAKRFELENSMINNFILGLMPDSEDKHEFDKLIRIFNKNGVSTETLMNIAKDITAQKMEDGRYE